MGGLVQFLENKPVVLRPAGSLDLSVGYNV